MCFVLRLAWNPMGYVGFLSDIYTCLPISKVFIKGLILTYCLLRLLTNKCIRTRYILNCCDSCDVR